MPRPPDRLQQWLAAIDVYQQGDGGKIALDVSTCTGPQLDSVRADHKRHLRTEPKTDTPLATQTLARGAVLPTDRARMVPEENVPPSTSQKTAYIVSDGRWHGNRYIS